MPSMQETNSMSNLPPLDPTPALRDSGERGPTHFTSLPKTSKHVTTGQPVLLDTVFLKDGTQIQHRT
jgi:hypothetical protein